MKNIPQHLREKLSHAFNFSESQIIDSEPPYEWEVTSQLMGRHTITVTAHGLHGEKESVSNEVILFIPEL